jgi:hypothetical protein
MENPVELFDWIINDNTLRGSKKDDNGCWMSTSSKPVSFLPQTRIVELEGGEKFIIKKETMCKALGLEKKSENTLNRLSTILTK